MAKVYGYVRISSFDQNEAIEKCGVNRATFYSEGKRIFLAAHIKNVSQSRHFADKAGREYVRQEGM